MMYPEVEDVKIVFLASEEGPLVVPPLQFANFIWFQKSGKISAFREVLVSETHQESESGYMFLLHFLNIIHIIQEVFIVVTVDHMGHFHILPITQSTFISQFEVFLHILIQ